jgi:hypothetical protein
MLTAQALPDEGEIEVLGRRLPEDLEDVFVLLTGEVINFSSHWRSATFALVMWRMSIRWMAQRLVD